MWTHILLETALFVQKASIVMRETGEGISSLFGESRYTPQALLPVIGYLRMSGGHMMGKIDDVVVFTRHA